MISVVGDSLDVALFVDVGVVAVIGAAVVKVDPGLLEGVPVVGVGIVLTEVLPEVLPEVVVTSLYRPSNGNGIVFSQMENTSLQYFSF